MTKPVTAVAAMILVEECVLRLDDPVDDLLPELADRKVLTGSDVLGVLVARASGQPFGTFLRERLFDPLGMTDTGFSVPAAVDRLPAQYVTDFATGQSVVYDEPDGDWAAEPAFPSGAGGLVSTVSDDAAFASMFRSRGVYEGQRILSGPAVELMTTDQLTPAQKAVSGLLPGIPPRA